MKKLIIAAVLFCAPAWAGEANMLYVPSEEWVSVEELVAAAKKVPDLEKRIEALEKRNKICSCILDPDQPFPTEVKFDNQTYRVQPGYGSGLKSR